MTGVAEGSDLSAGLRAVLAEPLGPVEVVELQRLTAGANRETWRFDAVGGQGTVPLIVQMDRDGDASATGMSSREGRLLAAVAAHGAPVPEVVALAGVENPLGRSLVITRRIEGETIARRLLRDDRWSTARDRFVDHCAAALAQIHAIPVDEPGVAELPRVTDEVGVLAATYDALGDPHPAFDLALRWLERHRPQPRPPALVHGDFRLGNLLLDDDGPGRRARLGAVQHR